MRKNVQLFRQIDKISFGRSILQGYQELAILSFGVLILFDGLPLFAALRTAKSEVNILNKLNKLLLHLIY